MKVPTPRKMSSGNYYIQMRLGGEYVNVTAPTEKECIRQAQKIKADYLAGERLRKSSNITLAAAIDNYIKARENVLSPSTIKGYRDIRSQRLQTYMNKPIKSINWQAAINLESRPCLKNKSCTNA